MFVAASERPRITAVKVFSATRSEDRKALGDRFTTWIQAHPDLPILSTAVRQSSDDSFHCLSIVVMCGEATRERL
jgi:hypothetical protein